MGLGFVVETTEFGRVWCAYRSAHVHHAGTIIPYHLLLLYVAVLRTVHSVI